MNWWFSILLFWCYFLIFYVFSIIAIIFFLYGATIRCTTTSICNDLIAGKQLEDQRVYLGFKSLYTCKRLIHESMKFQSLNKVCTFIIFCFVGYSNRRHYILAWNHLILKRLCWCTSHSWCTTSDNRSLFLVSKYVLIIRLMEHLWNL
jgi:hypothetical protein